MKAFIKKFLLLIVLPGCCLMALWLAVFVTSHWSNIGMLNLQIKKLKHLEKRHFDVVFIGDSSGGFGIVADNTRMLNLCLTRSYGFEGTSRFLDVIDRYITYDTLVVINALDVCTKKTLDQGVSLPMLYSDNIIEKVKSFKNTFQLIKPIIKDGLQHNFYYDNPLNPLQNYITSRHRISLEKNVITKDVLPKKLTEFKQLEEKIKSKNKPYYLFYGPSLPYDEQYLVKLNKALKERGIKHQFNRPFLLSTKTVGSSENHIHPDYADQSTKYYLDLLHSTNTNDHGDRQLAGMHTDK